MQIVFVWDNVKVYTCLFVCVALSFVWAQPVYSTVQHSKVWCCHPLAWCQHGMASHSALFPKLSAGIRGCQGSQLTGTGRWLWRAMLRFPFRMLLCIINSRGCAICLNRNGRSRMVSFLPATMTSMNGLFSPMPTLLCRFLQSGIDMALSTLHISLFLCYQSKPTELLCVKLFVESICYCSHGPSLGHLVWIHIRAYKEYRMKLAPFNGSTSLSTFMTVAMAINEHCYDLIKCDENDFWSGSRMDSQGAIIAYQMWLVCS